VIAVFESLRQRFGCPCTLLSSRTSDSGLDASAVPVIAVFESLRQQLSSPVAEGRVSIEYPVAEALEATSIMPLKVTYYHKIPRPYENDEKQNGQSQGIAPATAKSMIKLNGRFANRPYSGKTTPPERFETVLYGKNVSLRRWSLCGA